LSDLIIVLLRALFAKRSDIKPPGKSTCISAKDAGTAWNFIQLLRIAATLPTALRQYQAKYKPY
jgi:hypothetical protein